MSSPRFSFPEKLKEPINESMILPAAFGGTAAIDVILRAIVIEGFKARPSSLVYGGHKLGLGLFGGLIIVNAFLLGFNTGYYATLGIEEAIEWAG